MGELFRRFWLPVALAQELPGADCVPIRVKVLGEDLIAIRDSDGRPGLFDAYCPHRGAPMFFGRNEESGLRCVYHGWKFDVDGKCVDIPNAPEGPTFKNKIQIKCYPCVDAGDLVWAYMGPAEKKPPFPEFEWCSLPATHRYISKFRLECNYLQAMEGDGDPSHARFLHTTLDDPRIPNALYADGRSPQQRNGFDRPMEDEEAFPRAVGGRRITEADRAGWGTLEDHEAGYFSISTSEIANGRTRANISPWMMPIFSPSGAAGPNTYSSNMRIPIDNNSLMFYRLRWMYEPIPEKDLEEYKHGEFLYPVLIPGTWKTADNVSNDYNVDRVAQKNFTYTGIKTFPLQDIAMIENQWGPLADRTREHLASSDFQIIYRRRRLLNAAKALARGIEPTEPWHPQAYRYHIASAVADTPEEAVRQAKEKCTETRVASILERAAPSIRA